jgi:hypothetical protein
MVAQPSGPGQPGCPHATRRLLVAALAGIAAVLLAPAPADADRVTPRRSAGLTSDWRHRPGLPDLVPPPGVPSPFHSAVVVPTTTPGPPSEPPDRSPKPRPSPDDPPSAHPSGSPRPDPVSATPSPTQTPSGTDEPKPAATERRHKPVHQGREAAAVEPVEAPAAEPVTAASTWPGAAATQTMPARPSASPADPNDAGPANQATPPRARAAADRLVGRQTGFHRSMIYSGVIGLVLAFIGTAMVAWRRRLW